MVHRCSRARAKILRPAHQQGVLPQLPHLRPKVSVVKTSAGEATGPVGFLRVYDNAFGEVAQGGTRRGANMAVLRVEHPDIEEFIECKTNENHITNFNISVGVTDEFMKAVEIVGGGG